MSASSPSPEPTPNFFGRFPALDRLRGVIGKQRIPFIQQLAATECGAACLAMVLGYHGKQVRLVEVRDVIGIGRDGSTALALLDAAQWYGLRGRGVKVEIEDLDYLEPASILHWEFNHFVVFERLEPDGVTIVDPGFGRRRVPMEQFRRSFTGVAILLEPTEKFVPEKIRSSGIRRYADEILRDRSSLTRILVTSLLLQLFALGVPVLTGALVDRVVPLGDRHLLLIMSLGMLSLVVFHFLASMVRAYLLLHLRTHVDVRMTLGFLDHLVQLPYAFFQKRSAGDLMMRMNSTATIREILTASVLSGLLDGSLAVGYLILLFVINRPMGLLVLALSALQVLFFLMTRRRQRELMSANLEVESKAQSYEVEMLGAIETLKAMGSEQRAVEHWSDLFVDVLNCSLLRGKLSALMDSVMSTLRLASPLVILAYGALQVLQGELSLGTMLGLSALAATFLTPLSNLVNTTISLQLLGSYIERIDDVLRAETEQDRTKVRQAKALKGAITLENVSFRYDRNSPFVVRDVSVAIEPGMFVAIVGRSGSGKSTLASLLAGLYRPTSGRISYDGADMNELELHSLRRQMGIVTQKTALFGKSIRANITLSDPGLSMEAVAEAAKRAVIHEDIVAMPMGYETLLLDGGASLSGGQRQRIALARALVRAPAILLLDEATSALDAVSERQVQAEWARFECTRIVIAHRLSTIRDADLILVMDQGVMVERGTHGELMAQDGVYRWLVQAQLTPEGKSS